jgi:hypothetical protein
MYLNADQLKLVNELYDALAGMSHVEVAELEETCRAFRESSQSVELKQTRRLELLWVMAAVKKQKIADEKRVLQEEINRLDSL